MHASFFKGHGHQCNFSLVKGILWVVNFYLSISRAPRKLPGGMEAIAFVASVNYIRTELGLPNFLFQRQLVVFKALH